MSFVQKFIYAKPKRMIWFMRSMSDAFWAKKGEEKALQVFHETVENVAGYKDFILKHGIEDHRKIKNIADFIKYVPIANKENYLRKYPLEKISCGAVNTSLTTVSSSGSTGKVIYFPVCREDLEYLPAAIAAFTDYYWDIHTQNKNTLFVFAIALGMWMGGTVGVFTYKSICEKNKNFSLIIPGSDSDKVVEAIAKLGGHYDLINIISYPSFFKVILDVADRNKVDLSKFNLRLTLSGEKLDDNLRDYFISKLGLQKHPINAVFNPYGGTEFSNPGIVTPLSYQIKELCKKKPELSKTIFGTDCAHDTLLQNNPMGVYTESIQGELVMTKGGTVPIIRYAPQDLGHIISWANMMDILRDNKVDIEAELKSSGWFKPSFKWPFIVLGGRKDWAVSFFGASVAPESIQHIFGNDRNIYGFRLSDKDEEGENRFTVHIELQPSVNIDSFSGKVNHYHDQILDYLLENNFDFKDAYSIDKKIVDPKVIFYSYRTGPFERNVTTKIRLR